MGRLLRILCSVLLILQASSGSGTAVPQNASIAAPQPVLEDGTPVKLRISQTVSSADAHVDDRVEFEVLEEVRVADVVVIPKGGIAWGTVTEAQAKTYGPWRETRNRYGFGPTFRRSKSCPASSKGGQGR